jgi:hypothetical protein
MDVKSLKVIKNKRTKEFNEVLNYANILIDTVLLALVIWVGDYINIFSLMLKNPIIYACIIAVVLILLIKCVQLNVLKLISSNIVNSIDKYLLIIFGANVLYIISNIFNFGDSANVFYIMSNFLNVRCAKYFVSFLLILITGGIELYRIIKISDKLDN